MVLAHLKSVDQVHRDPPRRHDQSEETFPRSHQERVAAHLLEPAGPPVHAQCGSGDAHLLARRHGRRLLRCEQDWERQSEGRQDEREARVHGGHLREGRAHPESHAVKSASSGASNGRARGGVPGPFDGTILDAMDAARRSARCSSASLTAFAAPPSATQSAPAWQGSPGSTSPRRRAPGEAGRARVALCPLDEG